MYGGMAQPESAPKQPKKPSSVRHTRAIQRDRGKRPLSAPPDEQISARLTELVHPATLAQVAHFHELGLRERVLTLPLMVGLVLSMIWRHVGEAQQLIRLIRTESQLWVTPRRITQQAFSLRLRSLPAELFWNVLRAVLPQLTLRWQAREHRPLPPELAWARQHFKDVLVVDGSTLDALLRKVGLLRDLETYPLAGRMTALLSVLSRLPQHIWYEADAQAHDQRFWMQILDAVPAGCLLLFDLGYINFTVFLQLTTAQITFLTRAKRNLSYTLERSLLRTGAVHDSLIWIGAGEARQLVRLIEVLYHGQWFRYVTNELNPETLPTDYAVALYWQRWRIEDAYNIVKRLLGLAYFWTGAQNSIELQLSATWLLYAVLVDLTDAVADALNQPFARLSLEMVYRSLYFFTQAYHRGEASDVVHYLAANADWLGIIKRKRRDRIRAAPALTNSITP
jgi:hypothetical protein